MQQKKLLEPYVFQQEIIDRFKDESCAGLFLDMGVGKTLITSNIIRHKMNTHKTIFKTIIFCPIITLDNWKRELLMSTRIPAEVIGVVKGSKAKRLKILNDPKYKVLIINYEATRSDEIKQKLIEFNPFIAVCDESHMIKSRTARVFKAVMKITKHSSFKYALSGTPITNTAEDLFSQFMFLDGGETFGTRFYDFKGRYFINKNAGWASANAFPKWEFNQSLLSEFKAKIALKSMFLKKEDCLDLPQLVEQTIDVEMSQEQARHYKEIKNELITWLADQPENPLIVSNALTKLLRLNEILSGYMKLESGEIVQLKTNPRLDALMQLVENTNPHKIIIFSVFRNNYETIRKALDKRKIKYVEIHGGVSTKKKLEAVDIFNDLKNDVRVCVANPASGGVGVNLKAAKYTAFYTRNFSMKDFEQSKARNFRAGSIDLHEKITHYNFVTPDTIDESILAALLSKKKFAHTILSIKELLLDV